MAEIKIDVKGMVEEVADNIISNYGVEETGMTLKECVEKQILKRPHLEGDGYADGQLVYDTWLCPNCGTDYEVDYEEYKYCPECGQAIDWRGDAE